MFPITHQPKEEKNHPQQTLAFDIQSIDRLKQLLREQIKKIGESKPLEASYISRIMISCNWTKREIIQLKNLGLEIDDDFPVNRGLPGGVFADVAGKIFEFGITKLLEGNNSKIDKMLDSTKPVTLEISIVKISPERGREIIKIKGTHLGCRRSVQVLSPYQKKMFFGKKFLPKFELILDGQGSFVSEDPRFPKIAYEGNFQNNMFSDNTGKARCYFNTNFVYIGSFENGQRSGHGFLKQMVGPSIFQGKADEICERLKRLYDVDKKELTLYDGMWEKDLPSIGFYYNEEGNPFQVRDGKIQSNTEEQSNLTIDNSNLPSTSETHTALSFLPFIQGKDYYTDSHLIQLAEIKSKIRDGKKISEFIHLFNFFQPHLNQSSKFFNKLKEVLDNILIIYVKKPQITEEDIDWLELLITKLSIYPNAQIELCWHLTKTYHQTASLTYVSSTRSAEGGSLPVPSTSCVSLSNIEQSHWPQSNIIDENVAMNFQLKEISANEKNLPSIAPFTSNFSVEATKKRIHFFTQGLYLTHSYKLDDPNLSSFYYEMIESCLQVAEFHKQQALESIQHGKILASLEAAKYYALAFSITRLKKLEKTSKLDEESSNLFAEIAKDYLTDFSLELLQDEEQCSHALQRLQTLMKYKYTKDVEKQLQGYYLKTEQKLSVLAESTRLRLNITKPLTRPPRRIEFPFSQFITFTYLDHVRKFKESFAKELEAFTKEDRLTKYEKIKTYQEEMRKQFDLLISYMIKDCLSVIGLAHCRYDFKLLNPTGSMEVLPHFKVRLLLLINEEDLKKFSDQFKAMGRLIELQINYLTELNLSGNNSNSPIIFIGTPHQLVKLQKKESEGLPFFISRSITSSDPSLWSVYRTALEKYMPEANRSNSLINQIKEKIKLKDKQWLRSITYYAQVNLKEQFSELIDPLIYDLALYFNIHQTNTADILEAFRKKKIFDEVSIEILKDLVSAIYMMQVRLQLDYSVDKDKVMIRESRSFENYSEVTLEELETLHSAFWLFLEPFYSFLNQNLLLDEKGTLKSFPPFNLHEILFNELFKIQNVGDQKSAINFLVVSLLKKEPQKLENYYKDLLVKEKNEHLQKAFLKAVKKFAGYENLVKSLSSYSNLSGMRLSETYLKEEFEVKLNSLIARDIEMGKSQFFVEVNFPKSNEKFYLKKEIINQIINEQGEIKNQLNSSLRTIDYTPPGWDIALRFKQLPNDDSVSIGGGIAIFQLIMKLIGHGVFVNEYVKFDVQHLDKIVKTYYVEISPTPSGLSLATIEKKVAEELSPDFEKKKQQFLQEAITRELRLKLHGLQLNETSLDEHRLSNILLCLPFLGFGKITLSNFIVQRIDEKEALHPIEIQFSDSPNEKGKQELIFTNFDLLSPDLTPSTSIFNLFEGDLIDPRSIIAFLSLKPNFILSDWFSKLETWNKENSDDNLTCKFERGSGAKLLTRFLQLQAFLEQKKNEPIYIKEILELIHNMNLPISTESRFNKLKSKEIPLETYLPKQAALEIEVLEKLNFQNFFSLPRGELPQLQDGVGKAIESCCLDKQSEKAILEALSIHSYKLLNLSRCLALTDAQLIIFLEKSGNVLEFLDLSYCGEITDRSIRRIAKLCPNLKTLKLNGCSEITQLKKSIFQKLLFLEVSDCSKLKSINIVARQLNRLTAKNNPRLSKRSCEIPSNCAVDFDIGFTSNITPSQPVNLEDFPSSEPLEPLNNPFPSTSTQPSLVETIPTPTISLANRTKKLADGTALFKADKIDDYRLPSNDTFFSENDLIIEEKNAELESKIESILSHIEKAQPFINPLTNYEIIAILGGTDSGKSTILNYLMGCEMERIKINGQMKIIAKNPRSKIGHSKFSKTLIPSLHSVEDSKFPLCDLPGFLDSRGSEIRIANAVNIRNTLTYAKTTRILFLIDYATVSAGKGELLKNSIKNLIETFNNNLEDINSESSSILIGITHIDLLSESLLEDVLDGIKNDINEIAKELLGYKIDKLLGHIILINPLKTEKINGLIMQLNDLKAVKLSNGNFCSSLTPDDINLVHEISNYIKTRIDAFLKLQNVEKVAEEFKKLNSLSCIGHNSVKKGIIELQEQILSNVQTLKKEIEDNLETKDPKKRFKIKINMKWLEEAVKLDPYLYDQEGKIEEVVKQLKGELIQIERKLQIEVKNTLSVQFEKLIIGLTDELEEILNTQKDILGKFPESQESSLKDFLRKFNITISSLENLDYLFSEIKKEKELRKVKYYFEDLIPLEDLVGSKVGSKRNKIDQLISTYCLKAKVLIIRERFNELGNKLYQVKEQIIKENSDQISHLDSEEDPFTGLNKAGFDKNDVYELNSLVTQATYLKQEVLTSDLKGKIFEFYQNVCAEGRKYQTQVLTEKISGLIHNLNDNDLDILNKNFEKLFHLNRNAFQKSYNLAKKVLVEAPEKQLRLLVNDVNENYSFTIEQFFTKLHYITRLPACFRGDNEANILYSQIQQFASSEETKRNNDELEASKTKIERSFLNLKKSLDPCALSNYSQIHVLMEHYHLDKINDEKEILKSFLRMSSTDEILSASIRDYLRDISNLEDINRSKEKRYYLVQDSQLYWLLEAHKNELATYLKIIKKETGVLFIKGGFKKTLEEIEKSSEVVIKSKFNQILSNANRLTDQILINLGLTSLKRLEEHRRGLALLMIDEEPKSPLVPTYIEEIEKGYSEFLTRFVQKSKDERDKAIQKSKDETAKTLIKQIGDACATNNFSNIKDDLPKILNQLKGLNIETYNIGKEQLAKTLQHWQNTTDLSNDLSRGNYSNVTSKFLILKELSFSLIDHFSIDLKPISLTLESHYEATYNKAIKEILCTYDDPNFFEMKELLNFCKLTQSLKTHGIHIRIVKEANTPETSSRISSFSNRSEEDASLPSTSTSRISLLNAEQPHWPQSNPIDENVAFDFQIKEISAIEGNLPFFNPLAHKGTEIIKLQAETKKRWDALEKSLQIGDSPSKRRELLIRISKEILKHYAIARELSILKDFKQSISNILSKLPADMIPLLGNKISDYSKTNSPNSALARNVIDLFPEFESISLDILNAKASQISFKQALDGLRCDSLSTSPVSLLNGKQPLNLEQPHWPQSNPIDENVAMDYQLSEISGIERNSPPLKAKLELAHNVFMRVYSDYVKQMKNRSFNSERQIKRTLLLAKELAPYATRLNQHPEKTAELLANIFAQWSFLGSEKFILGNRSTLLQPHHTQILTIFRAIGIDEPTATIKNHLAQVKTGEGKSISLGAIATLFGLFDYDVKVVCYSTYLSNRDQKAFSNLFKAFNLSTVKYCNIDDLIEENLGNNLPDSRSLTKQFLKGESIKTQAEHQRRKSLLLLDEVDVFFGPDFYGKTVSRLVKLDCPEAKKLLEHIWEHKSEFRGKSDSPAVISQLMSHECTKKILSLYPNLAPLFPQLLKLELEGLNCFPDSGEIYHECEVKDNNIGYVDSGTNLVYNHHYRGRTEFAFLYYKEMQRITSDEHASDKVKMIVNCAKPIYSKLLEFYDVKIGLTATLEGLSDEENKILDSYGFTRRSYIPSTFEKKKIDEDKTVVFGGNIKAERGYFEAIVKEIYTTLDANRACLVVLKDDDRVKEFDEFLQNLPTNKDNYTHPESLVESLTDEEKDAIISRSITQCRATLLSKKFGRGIDFVCRDPALAEKGGVHVILTFYPETLAEEIQIKGRAGREDDPGSVKKILFEKDLLDQKLITGMIKDGEVIPDLSEFNKLPKSDQDWDTFLSKKRKEMDKKRCEEMTKNRSEMLKDHDNTLELAKAIMTSNKVRTLELLSHFNSN